MLSTRTSNELSVLGFGIFWAFGGGPESFRDTFGTAVAQ